MTQRMDASPALGCRTSGRARRRPRQFWLNEARNLHEPINLTKPEKHRQPVTACRTPLGVQGERAGLYRSLRILRLNSWPAGKDGKVSSALHREPAGKGATNRMVASVGGSGAQQLPTADEGTDDDHDARPRKRPRQAFAAATAIQPASLCPGAQSAFERKSKLSERSKDAVVSERQEQLEQLRRLVGIAR